MPRPRAHIVSLEHTAWYHVVCRCVRRAFLCGEDRLTGKNFDHRRGWIEARIRELAAIFTIDVAAYAIMSNHYHIVVKIDRDRAERLADEEVLARWTRLFSGPLVVQRFLDPRTRAAMPEADRHMARQWAASYRERLWDLSWFTRVLNESIARKANREDGVRGRFWEGRFQSQAILDEQALFAVMVYVDLNPIRAGIAETPEDSRHTSIEARLFPDRVEARLRECAHTTTPAHAAPKADGPPANHAAPTNERRLPMAPLLPFDATGHEDWALPCALEDYVELVETVGRCIHPKKRGHIPETAPRLLQRLGMDTEAFITLSTRLLKEFGHAVGTPESLLELAARRQARYLRGMTAARKMMEA
ncbi:transposase [Thermodesulfomicrobium sp. WS]|uniref:transposase n=1 Tax=Thermodesulfomicrobium sp. WS TaxID=3004129 RepID=UPI00248FAB55|nr:transposase [Thermodesulfomicrobium sp. WS]BDV01802.1 transposase [Thermodesulfomicrobium sp. WS]